jgi:hypothetical protein
MPGWAGATGGRGWAAARIATVSKALGKQRGDWCRRARTARRHCPDDRWGGWTRARAELQGPAPGAKTLRTSEMRHSVGCSGVQAHRREVKLTIAGEPAAQVRSSQRGEAPKHSTARRSNCTSTCDPKEISRTSIERFYALLRRCAISVDRLIIPESTLAIRSNTLVSVGVTDGTISDNQ